MGVTPGSATDVCCHEDTSHTPRGVELRDSATEPAPPSVAIPVPGAREPSLLPASRSWTVRSHLERPGAVSHLQPCPAPGCRLSPSAWPQQSRQHLCAAKSLTQPGGNLSSRFSCPPHLASECLLLSVARSPLLILCLASLLALLPWVPSLHLPSN